jgi:ribonuclease HI
MAGAVNHAHRLSRASIVNNEACPFCQGSRETPKHIFWECTAWKKQRSKHPIATNTYKPDWPSCFASCGILCDGVVVPSATSHNHTKSRPHLLEPSSSGIGKSRAPCRSECFLNGKVVVYTDGACMQNQSPALRRAGVGAWWCDGHPKNASKPLDGHTQTNQRAELAAVLYVLEIETRPVHIKSDSKYVVQGVLKHRFAWCALGWSRVANAVLWQKVHALLQSRTSEVTISKVKGHASEQDVRKKKVEWFDKRGNDAADELASAGARQHAVSADEVQRDLARKAVARDVQLMMIDTLCARSEASRSSHIGHRADE